MFILDQNKTTIVNLDNVVTICAFDFPSNGEKDIRVYFKEKAYLNLGTYKTKRAVEILEEIMKKMEVGARIYELPND